MSLIEWGEPSPYGRLCLPRCPGSVQHRFAAGGLAQTRQSTQLLGCLAAVHEVRRTRDEGRLVEREKHHGLGDLFGSPYSFERHGRRQTRLSFVSTGEAVQHPSLDWTWGHHVDAYPRRGVFKCGRLGQSFERMLARRVYGRASSTSMAVGRRHVDDAATYPGQASRAFRASC
jgi:hypothetical protein